MRNHFLNFKTVMIKYGWKYKTNINQICFYKPGHSAQFIIKKQNRNDIIRVTVPIPHSKYEYSTLLSVTSLNNFLIQHLENYEIKSKSIKN